MDRDDLSKIPENQRTPDLCLEYVKKDQHNLKYVKFPTKEMIEICLKNKNSNYELILQCFKEQPIDLCMKAIEQDENNLSYIHQPTLEMFDLCVAKCKERDYRKHYVPLNEFGKFLTFEKCKQFVEEDGQYLSLINWYYIELECNNDIELYKSRKYELEKIAVSKSPNVIEKIEEQVPELCFIAIEEDRLSFQYIRHKFRTEEVCKFAIEKDEYSFSLMKDNEKTENLCELAVSLNGMNLAKVSKKTYKICKLAVQNDGYALQFVDKEFQTDEIINIALRENAYFEKFIKK
jgi:hypothetical protein